MSEKFRVAEIFGPTIQGEGALSGSVSHFIRFGGCDFACKWCDSGHAVNIEEVRGLPQFTTEEIVRQVLALGNAEWVTLSGGNPVLYELWSLVNLLKGADYRVAVETQGSRYKAWLQNVFVTVSPKPPSSGMENPYLPSFLYQHKEDLGYSARSAHNYIAMKVPVHDEEDYVFARELHLQYPDIPFYVSVVTEMGGLKGDFAHGRVDTVPDILARWRMIVTWILEDPAMADVRTFPQLHALLWGHERGR